MEKAMSKQFAGKTAIVTGAASGIGEAVAKELAAGGATVIVSDLSEDKALEVCAAIGKAGGTALSIRRRRLRCGSLRGAGRLRVKKGGGAASGRQQCRHRRPKRKDRQTTRSTAGAR
jgi:NAD(P)-dependent dehydrogenase (short-subunit alcohol dehydrogenase family)